MLKIKIASLIVLCTLCLQKIQAQDTLLVEKELANDSLNFLLESPIENTQVSDKVQTSDFQKLDLDSATFFNAAPFKPNPKKAVIYSAIFPGLGQVYNRKYWKLPLIYGGFLGLSYAISWNGRYFNDYSDAYGAIMKDNPRAKENSDIWLPMYRPNINIKDVTESEIESLKGSFKRARDSYRRNRDLSIIGAVALYAICMIDAYVDAQLFDFDISPDLSMRVQPAMINSSPHQTITNRSYGIQCSLTF